MACHDRAVLVCEVSEPVLRSEFAFSEQEICSLIEIQNTVACELYSELETRGRHLRPIERPQSAFNSYNEFASSLTRPDWSPVQFVCAAQSPTAFQVADAIKSFYNEESQHNDGAFARLERWRPLGVSNVNVDRCRAHVDLSVFAWACGFTKQVAISRTRLRNRMKSPDAPSMALDHVC